MTVKIRTKDLRLHIPVPAAMIGFVIRLIPDKTIDKMRLNTPDPYNCLVTKEYIRMILEECLDILKENKGLEIVHVEAADGTFVSVKL